MRLLSWHVWHYMLQLPPSIGRGGSSFNSFGSSNLVQVVRYHSLVIDEESLPKELIPIAWTSSTDTLPFLGSQKYDASCDAYGSPLNEQICVNSPSRKSKNGRPWSFGDLKARSTKVLMGIMHSAKPHYGLQVCFGYVFVGRTAFVHFLTIIFCFALSFILRVLQLVMGGKYSRILEKLLRTIGSRWVQPPIVIEKFVMLVNYFIQILFLDWCYYYQWNYDLFCLNRTHEEMFSMHFKTFLCIILCQENHHVLSLSMTCQYLVCCTWKVLWLPLSCCSIPPMLNLPMEAMIQISLTLYAALYSISDHCFIFTFMGCH